MDVKDELIEALSKKYLVSPKEIRRAVDSQAKFVSRKMATEEMPEIRLPFWGIFRAKKSRIKHLNKSSKKTEQ